MWVPVGKHQHIVYNISDQRYKMIQLLSFLITYENNFLIDNQYVVGFYNGWFQILGKNSNSFCKRSVLEK